MLRTITRSEAQETQVYEAVRDPNSGEEREGRILRREGDRTLPDGRSEAYVIEYGYGEGAAWVEREALDITLPATPEQPERSERKVVVREHPQSQHQLQLAFLGRELVVPAVLDKFAYTVEGGAEPNPLEPHATFSVTEPGILARLVAQLNPDDFDRLKPNAAGTYLELTGDFGRCQVSVAGHGTVELHIGGVTLDFDPDRRPRQATIRKTVWRPAG